MLSPLRRCSCTWATGGHPDRVAVHLLEFFILHSISKICACCDSALAPGGSTAIYTISPFKFERSVLGRQPDTSVPLSICQRLASIQLRQNGNLHADKLLSLHFRFAGQHDTANIQQGLLHLLAGSRSAAAEVQSLPLHLHCNWTCVATPSTRNVVVLRPDLHRLAPKRVSTTIANTVGHRL